MAKKPDLKAMRQALSEQKPQGTVANILNQQSISVIRVHHSELYSVEQVRKKFEGLNELGASMEADGQHHPITVSPRDKQGYCIQKGERRWRAAAKRDLHVDIIVREPSSDEAKEVIGQLSENIHNDPLTPIEVAETLHYLQTAFKLDRTQLQKAVNKSSSYISQHLGLMKLPDCVRQLADCKVVKDADTLNSLRKAYDVDAEKTAAFIDSITFEGISRNDARSFHSSLKNEAPAEAKQEQPAAKKKTAPVSEKEQEPSAQEQHQELSEGESTSRVELDQAKNAPGEATETQNTQAPAPATQQQALLIEVLFEGSNGILLSDRIDPNGKNVWVKMPYGELEVPVEECNVTGVKYA